MPINLEENQLTRPVVVERELVTRKGDMPFEKECKEVVEFTSQILKDEQFDVPFKKRAISEHMTDIL